MSEVAKLYKNAGVEKEVIPCPAKYYGYDCTRNNWDDTDCSCNIEGYPPFTAEKQLALIIFLANREIRISPTYMSSGYYLNNLNKITSSRNVSTFENSLAQHINAIWQDLTEEEKETLRGILRA